MRILEVTINFHYCENHSALNGWLSLLAGECGFKSIGDASDLVLFVDFLVVVESEFEKSLALEIQYFSLSNYYVFVLEYLIEVQLVEFDVFQDLASLFVS